MWRWLPDCGGSLRIIGGRRRSRSAGQLAAWLNQDRDRQAARWFGEVLLITADQLAWIGGKASRVTRLVVSLHTQALLARGIAISCRWAPEAARSIRPGLRWTRSVDAELHCDR
jgi:hypothetical protein